MLEFVDPLSAEDFEAVSVERTNVAVLDAGGGTEGEKHETDERELVHDFSAV